MRDKLGTAARLNLRPSTAAGTLNGRSRFGNGRTIASAMQTTRSHGGAASAGTCVLDRKAPTPEEECKMARMIGEWTIDWAGFAARSWPQSLDDLVTSRVPDLLGGGAADDFCATVDENRQPCEPYLRVLPFGPNSTAVDQVVEDGDVLSFVLPELENGGAVEVLKQRGWHAEVCYKAENGTACQRAPWGDNQRDKPCNESDPGWVIHIFRPRFPALAPDSFDAMKQQVRLWKEIFGKHRFPADGDQYSGSHRYLDPADFSSVEEIEEIARKLLSRPRETMPDVPKVTCVQWSYQVLCLSLCVPLNERVLTRLGVFDAFRNNWPDMAGKTPPYLDGAGKLPFIPYSPAQVLQSFLDIYGEGRSLIACLQNPGTKRMLEGFLIREAPPGLPEAVRSYLEEVTQSGDITPPLRVPGRQPYRFVMPITYFCEARSAICKEPDEPWFQYVGTMIHESMVKRVG